MTSIAAILTSRDLPSLSESHIALNFEGKILITLEIHLDQPTQRYQASLQFFTNHKPTMSELVYLIEDLENKNLLQCTATKKGFTLFVPQSTPSNVEACLATYRLQQTVVSDTQSRVQQVQENTPLNPYKQMQNYAKHHQLTQLVIEVHTHNQQFSCILHNKLLFFLEHSPNGSMMAITDPETGRFKQLKDTIDSLEHFIIENLEVVRATDTDRVLRYSDQDDFTARISTDLREGIGTDSPTAELVAVKSKG